MIVWIDAQLSPAIAIWLSRTFSVEAFAVRDLQLRDAKDAEIFNAARLANAVVMTKDSDFLLLLERLGPPTSNYLDYLWKYFERAVERDLYRCIPQSD